METINKIILAVIVAAAAFIIIAVALTSCIGCKGGVASELELAEAISKACSLVVDINCTVEPEDIQVYAKLKQSDNDSTVYSLSQLCDLKNTEQSNISCLSLCGC